LVYKPQRKRPLRLGCLKDGVLLRSMLELVTTGRAARSLGLFLQPSKVSQHDRDVPAVAQTAADEVGTIVEKYMPADQPPSRKDRADHS
jgi:hypothetical protein